MISAAVVVVPIHDEAELLPACLHAMAKAIAASPVPTTLVLVLDDCRDASALICVNWAASHDRVEVIEISARNAGRARAVGVEYALESLTVPSEEIWIATSDADSRVPRRWLSEQLHLADQGIEAFAGTIHVCDWTEHVAGLRERFLEFYERGGTDSHSHVHGANLGVRGDAYLAAGGFAALATGEDHALWRALAQHRRIATRRLPVITSARKRARAPAGFSRFLVVLSGDGTRIA